MLVGIKAFEARWMELRNRYPTTAAENMMIAHAMGQLADHYATAEEIVGTLPYRLKSLFQELVEAYLHGHRTFHHSPRAHEQQPNHPDQPGHELHDAETLILDRRFGATPPSVGAAAADMLPSEETLILKQDLGLEQGLIEQDLIEQDL